MARGRIIGGAGRAGRVGAGRGHTLVCEEGSRQIRRETARPLAAKKAGVRAWPRAAPKCAVL